MTTTVKTQRVYQSKKLESLIVCYKGSHYVSLGANTSFTLESRVVVTPTTDGRVLVSTPDGALQETWECWGSYQKARKAPAAPTPASPVTGEGASPSALDSLLESAIKRTKVRQAV